MECFLFLFNNCWVFEIRLEYFSQEIIFKKCLLQFIKVFIIYCVLIAPHCNPYNALLQLVSSIVPLFSIVKHTVNFDHWPLHILYQIPEPRSQILEASQLRKTLIVVRLFFFLEQLFKNLLLWRFIKRFYWGRNDIVNDIFDWLLDVKLKVYELHWKAVFTVYL